MKQLLIFFILSINIFSLSFFTSCSEKNIIESKLRSYLAEVQQICGNTDNHVVYTSNLLPYPNRRDTRLKIKDIRIGFIDFFSLHDCDMQSLVAERNNALGKIMPATQLMIYEHRFLVKSLDCQSALKKDSEKNKDFLVKLEKIIAMKKENLPEIYWNATFSSPEFQKMFALAPFPLDEKELDTFDPHINQSLTYVINLHKKLGNSELTIDGKELEKYYYYFQKRKTGGEILLSLENLTFYLNQLSDTLNSRLNQNPLCLDGQPTEEAQKLFHIFRSHYAQGIQPHIVKLNRRAEEFLTLINHLAEPQKGVMPEKFKVYYHNYIDMKSSNGIWQQFREALMRHTQSWQKVLSQCGLAP